ncbi:MAG TPA: xanthine dehydrogenase family protein molybdopterin-binding subunit [Bryobacteraceae bacterium]|nr:xanthine dehydrogenase family protein molybdopterin-binding subunit [Bryobacteraceae bacterium]
MSTLNSVGHPTPRIDALKRVTGAATYTADIHLPGMLYARVLRSPHPHARIRKIDVSKAQALAGVKTILTHENCEIVWSSGDTRNKRYLFNNPVRFAGDAVAAVAAVDRHVAEEACRLIEVDYETLPFVLEPEDALKPDAPEIQPGGNLSPDNQGKHEPSIERRGNIEEGFKAADHVFEDHYQTPHINNAQLEPRASMAHWEGDKLIVYASTQGIANCRSDIAKDMGLPQEKVEVICLYMGGGFGNKNQCHDFDLMAAELSKRAAAPVRLEFTRKEDFTAVHGRWPTVQYYKVGVKNNGMLTAIQMRGYSGMGPYRKGAGDISGVEVYQVPHLEKTSYMVYTNKSVSANFRAPAYPQGVFALESIIDDAAHALKIDPLEFRLLNFTRKFRDQQPYSSSGLEQCLRKGAEKFGWKERWRQAASDPGTVKRGVGMGMGMFPSSLGRSNAIIRVDSKGMYYVHVGVTDCGTAAKTTMALIAAEALETPLSNINVVWGDTDTCPYSVGESGSRTTVFTGQAVIEAAKDLKKQMAEKGLPKEGEFWRADAAPNPQLRDFARYSFCAHFAEVEVDTETGHIRVTKFVAAHDSGRIVNPLTAESQVKGGATTGVGMALHEQLLYDKRSGLPLTAGYYNARIMTHMDAPEIEVVWVETEDPHGPYGAKTLGEPTIIPAVAAVANAFFNATGKRVKELPLTRDKVLGVVA